MISELRTLKAAFAEVDNVKSCEIGMEKGISPKKWPMIRLVPVRFVPAQYKARSGEIDIYFGWNIGQAQSGLEEVYEKMSQLEAAILLVVKAQGGRYLETITDEDLLPPYKQMRIRAEFDFARPVPAS